MDWELEYNTDQYRRRARFRISMDELQAAILRIKLKRLPAWTARRRKLAALYERGLAGLPLRLPDRGTAGSRNVFHLYPVRLKDRDALAAHLARRGIGSGIYYPRPLHLQPAYRGLGYRKGDFPHAEAASRTTLALPLFPELRDSEVKRVCRAVREAFAAC